MSETRTPLTPDMRVRDARDVYLRENGFTLAMYDEPTFSVPVGRWTVRLPNPPTRRRVVAAHDLHHVLTGYGTDFPGEIQISAWECRAGLGRSLAAWLICVPLSVFGLVWRPRLVLRAWRSAKGARSLLVADADIASLLDLPLREARHSRGIPERGAARRPVAG